LVKERVGKRRARRGVGFSEAYELKDAIVVGAGLAGLNCALALERAGLDVSLLEASHAVGGRVRTDVVEGFRLDRGFQVLLTSYPEARSALDYDALDLRPFKPGALIWQGGRFHRFADPFREPIAAMRTAFDPIVSIGDKLRVAKLRGRVMRGNLSQIFAQDEQTTRGFLEGFGFSPAMLDRFFEPFFGGVFLEKELGTSSRYFEFLFRMFSSGMVAVPALGMEAIPGQLAARLRPGTLLTGQRVSGINSCDGGIGVRMAEGQTGTARAVVVATEEPEARRLLEGAYGEAIPMQPRVWNQTTAFYFVADRAPIAEPILMLNGEGQTAGPVNNAVVMSCVANTYAPVGEHLVSVSVVGQAPRTDVETSRLASEVRTHLGRWFGTEVERWRLLKTYPIGHALPLQREAKWEEGNPRLGIRNVYLAGDFTETASIQGALVSGRRAAEALLADRSAG
jgi:phytoene dehydrogenase-like protein